MTPQLSKNSGVKRHAGARGEAPKELGQGREGGKEGLLDKADG